MPFLTDRTTFYAMSFFCVKFLIFISISLHEAFSHVFLKFIYEEQVMTYAF